MLHKKCSFIEQYKQQNCSGVFNLILLENSSFIPSYSFQSRHSFRMRIPSLIKSSNHRMESFYICFPVINFRYKRNSLLFSYWSLMNMKVKSDSNLNEDLIILIKYIFPYSKQREMRMPTDKENVYACGVRVGGWCISIFSYVEYFNIFSPVRVSVTFDWLLLTLSLNISRNLIMKLKR